MNSNVISIANYIEQRKAKLRSIIDPVVECIMSPEVYNPGISWDEYHAARRELKRLEVLGMSAEERFAEFDPELDYQRWQEWEEAMHQGLTDDTKQLFNSMEINLFLSKDSQLPPHWNGIDWRESPQEWVDIQVQKALNCQDLF